MIRLRQGEDATSATAQFEPRAIVETWFDYDLVFRIIPDMKKRQRNIQISHPSLGHSSRYLDVVPLKARDMSQNATYCDIFRQRALY